MEWFASHSLLCLLTLAALGTVFWAWRQRRRLDLRLHWVLLLSVLHVAVGVACVKAFAILEAGSLSAAGNMSLFGAIFFLPLFYWLGAKLFRRRTADVFDVFTIPTVFTLACARANCLITGCCLGRLIPGMQQRWPTREAELVFYAVLLPCLIIHSKKKEAAGSLWPIYIASYGAFRFAVEFFRESETAFLFHLSHLWAILSLLIGVSVLLEQNRRKTTQSNHASFVHRRKRK